MANGTIDGYRDVISSLRPESRSRDMIGQSILRVDILLVPYASPGIPTRTDRDMIGQSASPGVPYSYAAGALRPESRSRDMIGQSILRVDILLVPYASPGIPTRTDRDMIGQSVT